MKENKIYLMNRKGGSDVVIAVLLILVSIGAAIMLWGIIQTQVNRGSEQIESKSECISEKLNPQLIMNKVCLTEGNEIEMQIFRKFKNEEIKEISINFYGDSKGARFLAGGKCRSCSIPSSGETVTYRFSPYPNERFSEASLEYEIGNCPSTITPIMYIHECS